MKTAIDGTGRVVIPKAIRDALGLSPGLPVTIAVRDGAVVIEPAPTPMRLVQRGKGLVAEPDSPLPTLTAEDARAVLDASRR